jgi:hypothetical protein
MAVVEMRGGAADGLALVHSRFLPPRKLKVDCTSAGPAAASYERERLLRS